MGYPNGSTDVVAPGAGAMVKQGFDGRTMEVRAETAATAIAEQARAAVQARYIMALQRPRDWDVVRQRLMRECDRPGFAEVARYAKPVGGGSVEGLSIRFAEAALRCLTNCLPEVSVVYEDEAKRIVRVALTDLEANLTYSKDLVVEKVVERSRPKDGQAILAERVNSHGKKVFLVQATEDELANKQAALESKALRGHVLRVLPGDIADEAEERIFQTLKKQAQKDPAAERKRIIDAFGQVGVPVEQLKEYVGKPFEQLSPAELVELRTVHSSVKNGEARWSELLEARAGKARPSAPAAPEANAAAAAAPAPEAPAAGGTVVDAAPSPAPEAAAPAAPRDVLEAAILAAQEERALDPLVPQVSALPKGERRTHLGELLNTRRRALRGGGR